MLEERSGISRSFVVCSLILSIIAWQFAIALCILLSAQDYMGFNGVTQIAVTACSQSYFTSKETAIQHMIEVSYIGSLLAVIWSTVVFVMMLVWVVRVCKGHLAD